MIPPPVPSTFKWTGCAACTHRARQPITGPLRSGPSGFGTLLHQWDERRGGDVCVLDTAYLGFDMYTTEVEACLSNQLKCNGMMYYLRLKALHTNKRCFLCFVLCFFVVDKTQMGPVCAKYGGINIKSPISKKGHKNEILTTNIRHRHFLMSVKVRSPYWDTKMNFIRCHTL